MRTVLIVLIVFFLPLIGKAQYTPAAAVDKLIEVTKVFHSGEAYACDAIVEIKYKGGKPLVDSSRLICKDGFTWYKSGLVERVESSAGEIIVNHELKIVNLWLSDSIRAILQMELNAEGDEEFEAMLDADFEAKDFADFKQFLANSCNVKTSRTGDLEEISFTPKDLSKSVLVSMIIRFDKDSKVRYYEYTTRDVYARDYYGNSRFRLVRTIYDNLQYEQVPEIPSKFTDFLEWNGWTVKLKKYTNYKLSVL